MLFICEVSRVSWLTYCPGTLPPTGCGMAEWGLEVQMFIKPRWLFVVVITLSIIGYEML